MFPVEKEMMMSVVNEGVLQQSRLGSDRKVHNEVSPAPSTVSREQGMFATAILEEDAGTRGKRAARTGAALVLQIAIVGTLVLLPLFFTEGLDLYKMNTTLLVAPPPPSAPPPPMARAQAVTSKPTLMKAQLTAPTVIPKKIAVAVPDAGAAPSLAGMQGGVVGGVGDVLGGAVAGPPPPPPAAAPVERPKGPIRIYSGMKEPELLYAPPIVYNPIAKAAHVSGTVMVEAIIDEKGNVTQVHVISGPPLLLQSAIDAVAGRRYAPTILDGEPVSIRLEVRVDFRMS
jgi:periplasmic protein TonB